jgi:hypothetical protein
VKFRKKPVVIEAVQWIGTVESLHEVQKFSGYQYTLSKSIPEVDTLEIYTLEGVMTASKGDWIIKGVQGEFYPCKPDIFEETYETVDSASDNHTVTDLEDFWSNK